MQCFALHSKAVSRGNSSQITEQNRRMKFNTTLSVAGTILLYTAGSLSQLDVCGRAPLNGRIVGGENATAGAWSWLNASDIVMYFGRLNQSGSNPYETSRSASRIITHPNFNSSYSPDNDIALVQLSSSVSFSEYIKPVCLAAAGSVFSAGTESWVTGWGRLQHEGQLPDVLQEVMIPIVSYSDCDNAYKGINISITSGMICAGLLNQGGKGACQGDSGGPMASRKGSLWIQSGIVSFGKGCADPTYPGVYTRVSQYQDWIKSYMGSNPPGFVAFNPTSNSNFRSVPNLLLCFLSLTFSIIPFTFSLYLAY